MWKKNLILSVLAVSPFLTDAQVSLDSTKLPIVVIDTDTFTIVDEPKKMAHMGIIDNGPGQYNYTSDPFNDYDGTIGIELRGSSSQYNFDKKSFGIELWTDAGADTSAMVLGMPVEEDWVLHGPYSDKSLIRNMLAFYLAGKLGRYASRTRLCEVIINDDYRGVYVMLEKVKRDNDRIDIANLNPDEISGDELTGGYIVKLDKFDGNNSGEGWASPYPPPGRAFDDQAIFFQYEDPKGRDIVSQQEQYIQKFITDFETVLKGPNFKMAQIGYRAFIDEYSFIDYSLFTELTRNVDAYRLSTFLYKDRDSNDGLMKIGPPWDYNLAFGNANYCRGSDIEGWAWDFNDVCNEDFWLIPFWWKRLLLDETYVSNFKLRWAELRQGPYSDADIMAYIDSLASVLDGPQQRNFERWDVMGEYVWPNEFVGTTYEEEIQYLKNWVTDRLAWMDENVPSLDLITGMGGSLENNGTVIYPNPFSERLSIYSDKPVRLIRIHDITGQLLFEKEMQEAVKDLSINVAGDIPEGLLFMGIKFQDGSRVVRKVVKE